MRIDGTAKVINDRFPVNAVEGKSADTFAAVMKKSQSQLQLNTLNQLLDRVDALGQKLAKQRTLENLIEYKTIVKRFVGEAVNSGLQLSDKQSFQPGGEMKSHQLVEVINEKLIEMNDEVLNNEKEGIDMLRLVGEIKGLLINLYM